MLENIDMTGLSASDIKLFNSCYERTFVDMLTADLEGKKRIDVGPTVHDLVRLRFLELRRLVLEEPDLRCYKVILDGNTVVIRYADDHKKLSVVSKALEEWNKILPEGYVAEARFGMYAAFLVGSVLTVQDPIHLFSPTEWKTVADNPLYRIQKSVDTDFSWLTDNKTLKSYIAPVEDIFEAVYGESSNHA